MSRIRSVHPGLFTDEAFVSVSMAARVLFPGIWTECDDQGVFEWKPVTLKMRIFPADNVDVVALLSELVGTGSIQQFTHEGKEYGAVRNFRKFQKPKKPLSKHPLPAELRTFVALTHDGSEPLPHQLPTSTEKSRLMEEEDGEERERKKEDTADAVSSSASAFAFESGVIRLKQKDFDQWKQAFSQLDLTAELLALTEWAGEQPKWFFAVSSALAKRNREAKSGITKGHGNGGRRQQLEAADSGSFKGALARLRETEERLRESAVSPSGSAPPRLLSNG